MKAVNLTLLWSHHLPLASYLLVTYLA